MKADDGQLLSIADARERAEHRDEWEERIAQRHRFGTPLVGDVGPEIIEPDPPLRWTSGERWLAAVIVVAASAACWCIYLAKRGAA